MENRQPLRKSQGTSIDNATSKKHAIAAAEVYTEGVCMASLSIQDIFGNNLDVGTVTTQLKKQVKDVLAGNEQEIEILLMTQAQTLNAIFHQMATNMAKSKNIEQIRVFADVSLRAQNQSRKALAALVDIRRPAQSTIIRQQNNALNQQINNAD